MKCHHAHQTGVVDYELHYSALGQRKGLSEKNVSSFDRSFLPGDWAFVSSNQDIVDGKNGGPPV